MTYVPTGSFVSCTGVGHYIATVATGGGGSSGIGGTSGFGLPVFGTFGTPVGIILFGSNWIGLKLGNPESQNVSTPLGSSCIKLLFELFDSCASTHPGISTIGVPIIVVTGATGGRDTVGDIK